MTVIPVVNLGGIDISACVRGIVMEGGIGAPKLTLDLSLVDAPALPDVHSRPVYVQIKYPLAHGHFSTTMTGNLISAEISTNHPYLTLVFDVELP
jgi:hypothetical protein